MKKAIWSIVIYICLLPFLTAAQRIHYKKTWLTGHVQNLKDSLKIEMVLYNYHSNRIAPEEIKTVPDQNGNFRMLLPHIIRPTETYLYFDCRACSMDNTPALQSLTVDPGDSVHLEIKDITKGQIEFAGKEAAKYEFISKMKPDFNLAGWD